MTSDASRLQWKMWQVKKKKKDWNMATYSSLQQLFCHSHSQTQLQGVEMEKGCSSRVNYLWFLSFANSSIRPVRKQTKFLSQTKELGEKKCLTKCRHTLLAQDSGEKKKSGRRRGLFSKTQNNLFFFSISLTIFIFQSFTGIQFSPT